MWTLLSSRFLRVPVLVLGAPLFLAWDYGRPIDIRSEEELQELYYQGELSEEELERLQALLKRPLDPARASPELLADLPGVTSSMARALSEYARSHVLQSADDLLAVPGFTHELLDQARPFLKIRKDSKKPRKPGAPASRKNAEDIRSELILRTAWEGGDEPVPVSLADAQASGESYYPVELGLDRSPSAYLLARAEKGHQVQVGLVTTLGEGPSQATFLPDDQAIQLTWSRPLAALNKAYVLLEQDAWTAIGGSYVAGFGERLVFDETRRSQPSGLEPDDDVYGTSSYAAPRRLLGLAGSLELPVLGQHRLNATAFASIAPRDLYQYDFVLPGREDAGAELSTPVLLQGVQVYPMTLPNAYQERTLGASVRLSLAPAAWVGWTGYYSWIAKTFDFTFKSGLPERSGFGALGLDFGAELHTWKVTGEAALTDQGQPAFLVRGEGELQSLELMALGYFYGTGYDNPHSRGPADADTLDGKRDQDETGLELRATWRPVRPLRLRAQLHPFYRPSLDVWRFTSEAATELEPMKGTVVTLWTAYKDRNLLMTGRSLDYSAGTAESYANLADPDLLDDALVEPPEEEQTAAQLAEEPNGARLDVALKVRSSLFHHLALEAGLRRFYQDASYRYFNADCTADYGWQVGQDLWLKGRYALPGAGQLSGRLRYLDEDVYGTAGVRQLEPWIQYEQSWGLLSLRLRYGATVSLDDAPTAVSVYCEDAQGDPCAAVQADEALVEEEGAAPVHALQVGLQVRF